MSENVDIDCGTLHIGAIENVLRVPNLVAA